MFRKHHQLPDNWVLATAKNESLVRDFLNQFNYQLQKTSSGFDHPNSAFVLSNDKHLWTGMIAGTNGSSVDIARAIGEANYAGLDGVTQKLVQILKQPEYLIALGFAGIVWPLLLIIYILARRRKSERDLRLRL